MHGYSDTGTLISQYIWNFEFAKVTPFLQWSTSFISFFTGVVYSIIGPSIFGGYLVYAFLSFLGSYFFYKAFRVTFPNGSKRLYMWLIFFFPSILFWPSAIGKDALMFLSIGLLAYGGAQIIKNQLPGLIPLVLGFLGALWVRPHIAMILILALALAFFLPGARKRPFRPATYIIGLLAVGGLAWYLLPKVMAFISLEELSPSGINEYLQQYQGLSYQGGSAFQAINLNNPLDYLMIPVTILFRPFPWETGNLQALVESLAGVIMLFLILWRTKSLGRALAASISNIYLRFILINIVVFVIIFAALTNFGTLARERVMIQPFLFMLISYGSLKPAERQNQPIEGVYVYQK